MTNPNGSARGAFLAELREQRAKLDQLISQIEGMGPSTPSGDDGGPSVGRHDFVGMTTPEAIKKYLRKKKGLHAPRAIAQALVDGGYGEDVEAVYVNVYSALKRMRAASPPEIVKHKQEWGLAEHFPNLAKKKAPDDDGETPPEKSTGKETAA